MSTCFKTLLLASIMILAAQFALPERAASADDYWDGYWSWYDGTYRPYYNRRYRGGWDRYDYGTGYRYGYDPYDYDYGRYNTYRPYYGGYYYGYPQNTIQLGPFSYSWR